MHILIAPNAFKNSLDALPATKAIEKGLQQSRLACTTECFPVGDGGDGTGALIIQHCKGEIIHATAHDALGRKINTTFGLIDNGNTAVIELANASGIRLVKQEELAPLHAITYGTGELILHALNKHVKKIILCIGGSATVDGGTGILRALGIKFLNSNQEIIHDIPYQLKHLTSIDTSAFDKRILDIEFIILCDVENTLLGKDGAATVFGPQKGATVANVQELEQALTVFNKITLQQKGKNMAAIKHGGAAGGVAAALAVFCNARLVQGIDYFLSLTNFDEALQKANIVITGEGKIDAQTLHGKAPYGVAKKSKRKKYSCYCSGRHCCK